MLRSSHVPEFSHRGAVVAISIYLVSLFFAAPIPTLVIFLPLVNNSAVQY